MSSDTNADGDYAATVLPVVQDNLDKNRPLLALAAISSYLERHGTCAEAHNDLAVVHHLCGHAAEALESARKAAALAPHQTNYARNWASILNAVGRYEEAISVLVRILEADARDVEALVLLGDANRGLGRLSDAAICLQVACEIDPTNEVLRERLALGAPVSKPEEASDVASNGERATEVASKPERTTEVAILVFSKDRALQLDGLLRSLRLHGRDLARARLTVLFKTTSPEDDRQYGILARTYPEAEFLRETSFLQQLVARIAKTDYVLFLVDDCLFVGDFQLSGLTQALEREASALGVSLRLGRNTTYCYMHRSTQRVPELVACGSDLARYRWVGAEHDFGYPLEVSSSLFRAADLREVLASARFTNPNTLEAALAAAARGFAGRRPDLLCFERSIAFCNPVNMVQTQYVRNRAGSQVDCSAQALRARFAEGARMRVEAYSGYVPTSCHEEVAMELEIAGGGRVSVLMPVRDTPCDQCKQAVESILAQTHAEFEFVIVNDASTNRELNGYLASLAERDRRIVLVQNEESKGLAYALDLGLGRCSEDLVVRMDSDDIARPRLVERQIAFFAAHPDAVVCGVQVRMFGDSNRETRLPAIVDKAYALRPGYWLTNHPGVAFRKGRILELGGYGTTGPNGAEDYSLWCRVLARGWVIYNQPEVLLDYRSVPKPERESESWLSFLEQCKDALRSGRERAAAKTGG